MFKRIGPSSGSALNSPIPTQQPSPLKTQPEQRQEPSRKRSVALDALKRPASRRGGDTVRPRRSNLGPPAGVTPGMHREAGGSANPMLRGSRAFEQFDFEQLTRELDDFDISGGMSSGSEASSSAESSSDEEDVHAIAQPPASAMFDLNASQQAFAEQQQRVQQEDEHLFRTLESVVSQHRVSTYDQYDHLPRVVPQEHERPGGMCFGLSVQWLKSSQRHPRQSTADRTALFAGDPMLHRALGIQQAYFREQAHAPFSVLRVGRAAIAGSGVELGKYKTFERYEDFDSLTGFAAEIARHIDRKVDRYAVITMNTNVSGHVIACVKQRNGRINVFDPNSGSFEAMPSGLGRVLSGILASFLRDAQQSMQEQAATGNAYAVESHQQGPQQLKMVRVIPATVSDTDSGGSASHA
ncbi:YopT-type cysteine protease domain-containing protein [Ralstonia pseudosolanacearum]